MGERWGGYAGERRGERRGGQIGSDQSFDDGEELVEVTLVLRSI
jgi:hypothetical protein